jgi:hypothetical protein
VVAACILRRELSFGSLENLRSEIMSVCASELEGSMAVGVLGSDICVLADKDLHKLRVTVGSRKMQWRAARLISRIDERSLSQQDGGDVVVAMGSG